MMRVAFVLCIMTGSAFQIEEIHRRLELSSQNPSEKEELTDLTEAEDGNLEEFMISPERTWKMSKKSISFAVIAIFIKALLLIKLALAKLAILGNISIMLSKLSLILSLVLTLGKYFGGISKMLNLRTAGYDGYSSYQDPGHSDHGSYVT